MEPSSALLSGDLVARAQVRITVDISRYHYLFTRLRTSRTFSAAPTIVAFHLVLPGSLNVVFCPQPYVRAPKIMRSGSSSFPAYSQRSNV